VKREDIRTAFVKKNVLGSDEIYEELMVFLSNN